MPRLGAPLLLATLVALAAPTCLLAQGAPIRGLGTPPPPPGPAQAPVTTPGVQPDRSFLALPPAYPRPRASFVPIRAGGSPPTHVPAPTPATPDPVWVPERLDVVTGIDATGRVTHALERVPGRFENPSPP